MSKKHGKHEAGPEVPQGTVKLEPGEVGASTQLDDGGGHVSGPRNRIIGLRYVSSSEIATNDKNWRRHPQVQRDAFRQVLGKVGVAGAVIAYKSDRNGGALTLIDGHMRSDELHGQVPVLELDVNDEEADLLLFSYDRLGAAANEDLGALEQLMSDIRASSIGEMDQMFRALDYERMKEKTRDDVKDREDNQKAEYPIEPVFDEAYSYLVVFTKTEQEWRDLMARLPMEKTMAKGSPANSHVVPAARFFAAWDNRPYADTGEGVKAEADAQKAEE